MSVEANFVPLIPVSGAEILWRGGRDGWPAGSNASYRVGCQSWVVEEKVSWAKVTRGGAVVNQIETNFVLLCCLSAVTSDDVIDDV